MEKEEGARIRGVYELYELYENQHVFFHFRVKDIVLELFLSDQTNPHIGVSSEHAIL